jgi:hypothetical protein
VAAAPEPDIGHHLDDAGMELPFATTQQISRRPGEVTMVAI